MSPIFESHTMDFTARVQHAQRADGQWFSRVQSRHPRFGYQWTAWRPSAAAPAHASLGLGRARLPKSAAGQAVR